MDPITGLVTSKAVQEVSRLASEVVGGNEEQKASSFEALMRDILPDEGAGQIDEEALFAALVEERLSQHKGQDAADQFQQNFQQEKESRKRSDGYIPVEDAANSALAQLVEAGVITSEEQNTIHSEAFQAAQLDDKHDTLYDSRGSESDPTVAVAALEAALLSARTIIEQIDSGDLTPTATDPENSTGVAGESTSSEESDAIAPTGGEIDGEGGFVFKPLSESNGNLVVLLPTSFAKEVEGLILRDQDGNEVERGQSTGFANGNREHFRFSKPGGDYPENLTVEVQFKGGDIKEYFIPDPDKRYD